MGYVTLGTNIPEFQQYFHIIINKQNYYGYSRDKCWIGTRLQS